jgi:hypothetical protein
MLLRDRADGRSILAGRSLPLPSTRLAAFGKCSIMWPHESDDQRL